MFKGSSDHLFYHSRRQNSLEVYTNSFQRPVGSLRSMTMFEGVDMDIIHMAAVILLIPDQVFPIMTLPDAPLPVA